MRFLGTAMVAVVVLAATPVFAQNPKPDEPKTQTEIEAEKAAQRAYQRSLSNIPDKTTPSDPWGTVRSEPPAGSTAPKPASTKRSKTGNTATTAK